MTDTEADAWMTAVAVSDILDTMYRVGDNAAVCTGAGVAAIGVNAVMPGVANVSIVKAVTAFIAFDKPKMLCPVSIVVP